MTMSRIRRGFIEAFQRRYDHEGTALQLVQIVTDTFPSFQDKHWFEGHRSQYATHHSHSLTHPLPTSLPLPHSLISTVFFLKSAQILVAETWAAFSPRSDTDPLPLFPRRISQLTMFVDYCVPQILHHLRLLTYPPSLVRLLEVRIEFPSSSSRIDATREEVATCAASNHHCGTHHGCAACGQVGRLWSVQCAG